jgi:hypothetical protein
MGNHMSKFEKYIVSIMARIEVDDTQRVEIERELRTHLEEAIADGVNKGYTREQAESEAMLAFGDSTHLAKMFGARTGFKWLLFERIIFALLLTMALGDHNEPLSYLIWGPIVCYFIFRRVYNRVLVNGGIEVRRLFRRRRKIEFADIESVSLGKFHLFGFRKLVVQYAGKRIKLLAGMRGMRAAAVTLDALVPDNMDSRTRKYIARLPMRIRREKPWVRWTLTAIWAILFLNLIYDAYVIKHLDSPGKSLAISLVLPIFLWIIQGFHHTDYCRRGLSWFMALWQTQAIALSVYAIFFYTFRNIYMSIIFLMAAASIGLLLLCWKTSPKRLLIAALSILVIAYATAITTSPSSPEITDACNLSDQRVIVDAQWHDNNTFVFLSMTPYGSQFIEWIGSDLKQGGVSVPQGMVVLLPQRQDSKSYFTKMFLDGDAHVLELYQYDIEQATSSIVEDYPTSFCLDFMRRGGHCWSPDGRLLHGYTRTTKEGDSDLLLYDMVKGSTSILAEDCGIIGCHWDDNHNLRIRKDDLPKDATLRKTWIYGINIDDKKTKLLYESNNFGVLPGLHYALQKRENENRVLVDIDTLEEKNLGKYDGYSHEPYPTCWHWQSSTLAYIEENPSDGKQSIKVLDIEENRTHELAINPKHFYYNLQLSPDGNHLIFYHAMPVLDFFSEDLAMGFVEVWNIKADTVKKLYEIKPCMHFMHPIFVPMLLNNNYPVWNNDSTRIALFDSWYNFDVTADMKSQWGLSIFFFDI